MNYYEHHIGDYAEATAHLSFIEDAAYSRLIRKYYACEKPLPADQKAVQRLVGARTKEEREAVATVLEEFFDLQDDGWHNTRCDEEIARYQDKQAKAKRSAEARWSKPKTHSEGNANASPDAMRTHSEGNAHQAPSTNHQTPDIERGKPLSAHATDPTPVSSPAEVCKALKTIGIGGVSPSHPELLALIEAGASVGEFEDAGRESVGKAKPFAYALAIVKRRRDSAAVMAETLHRGALPSKVNKAEQQAQSNRRAVEDFLKSTEGNEQ